MIKKRIIILGAGLAGLSAAWYLQKKGCDCEILEKEGESGGLCRSKSVGGFTFDYDGHLLHFRHQYTLNLVKDLLGSNLSQHERSAWIYSGDAYTRYPFQANLYGLPSSIVKECLLGFIEASKDKNIKDNDNLTFLDWIYLTFGKGIARHFMIPYNTKFWTLPPQELVCSWLDGFIPVPSLAQTIEGTIGENKRKFGYNARFWYPRKGGIAVLSKAFAKSVKNIRTNCDITHIDLKRKEIETKGGVRKKFDYIISTIPLPQLPGIIEGLPKKVLLDFGKLRWNSIFNLNLGIEGRRKLAHHWIYFPQKNISFFRAGFFHNFSKDLVPSGKSSIYTEVSYSESKPIDKKNISLHIVEDLKKVGLLDRGDRICIRDTNDIKYAYPIYDKNYRPVREEIVKFLLRNNVIPCGRYGSWRYMSMEDAILSGKEAAEKVGNILR